MENTNKSIFIQGIGNIELTRRKTCKRIVIRINRNREVKVSVPYRISLAEGERFVFEKIDWIRNTSLKIKTEVGSTSIFDVNTIFKTRSRRLAINRITGTKFKLSLLKDIILIGVPISLEISDVSVQKSIKKLLIHAIRTEAQEYLPIRTAYLAEKYNFSYVGVKVKNASTRWGSCSYRNNINLNIHLVRIPDELSDYVIIHELVHTIHKNHGPKFWALLDSISGEAKQKSVDLKQFKTEIYANT